MSKKITVAAYPAFSNKDKNPYNHLLYTNMNDVDVVEGGVLNIIYADVLHFHWPELFLNHKKKHKFFGKMIILLLIIIIAKILRKKIVWTVHNLKPHENLYKKTSNFFYNNFYKICDGLLFLSEYSFLQAKNSWMRGGVFYKVIPHGNYSSVSANKIQKNSAKKLLGVPEDSFMYLYFGMIRRYKNVPKLINEFKKIKSNSILYIAGNVVNDENLSREIKKSISGDDRIFSKIEYISDDYLNILLSACDVVVVPFSDVANSGSVIMALSYGKNVIAPKIGGLPELNNIVGGIMFYENDFSCESLELSKYKDVKSIEIDNISWEVVSKNTENFYIEICAHD